jgi:hypothetical protein
MLDDLRNTAKDKAEQDEAYYEEEYQGKKQFLGMTAPQRFIVVLMLLFMTCILGSFFLIIFGKISLPFF